MPVNREFLQIFQNVSRATPGSTVGQALGLALEGIRNKRVPQMLREAINDADTIEAISLMAENDHKAGHKKNAKSVSPLQVDRGLAQQLLNEQRKLLPRLQNLPRKELEELIALYKKIKPVADYEIAVLDTIPRE